jgi:hypothetical protein
LRRDYAPVSTPNPTLLGASGHFEAGNTTVMIDPSETPNQQIDSRQTSIIIDDWNDSFQTPAPRATSRQLAPLAIVGLGLLAFAGGLGGMAVVSKLVNPPASVTATVTDPSDPNTVAIAKPSDPNANPIQDPNSSDNPKTIPPAVSVNNSSSKANSPSTNANTKPVVKSNQSQQTKPTVVITPKPPTNQKPANPTTSVKTPEIAPQPVKPSTKTQITPAKPNDDAQVALERQKAQAKAAALEKTRQAQLEKVRLAQIEKVRLETINAAREKQRQAVVEQARVKANKLALEKARQTQLEKAQTNAKSQALQKARAKATEQARIDARIKARNQARNQARIDAANQARNARAQELAKVQENQRAQELASAKAAQRARDAAQAKVQAKARAQARIRTQAQSVVVNSSARNLANNRSQFYAWDRNGAVLKYNYWSQIPQSVKTARAGSFRAAVFVAASPAAMPDIRR